MNDRELSPTDVFTFVFEEYFKDGVLEDEEKQKIYLLRTALGISGEEYVKIMTEVHERFQRGEIEFEDTSHEYNNIQIYKKILSKALADNAITDSEEKIILKAADILMISRTQHMELLESMRLKLRQKEKKYQIEALDPDFPVLDISIVKNELPEISIDFDLDRIDRGFMESFMNKYEEPDFFYVSDQEDEQQCIIFMDTNLKNRMFKIYLEEREKNRFFNFFPQEAKSYLIKFCSRSNSETIHKCSAIDRTGDYYSGIRTFLEGDVKKAITLLENVLEENNNIFNLHNIIGLCYKLRSNFDEALKSYQSELKYFPQNNRAISNIAIVYKQLTETVKSVYFFEKALSLDPLDPNCLMSAIATYSYDHNKNINKILNFIFVCSQLWNNIPAYGTLLANVIRITGEQNLEQKIIQNNAELIPVIREFFWVRNLYLTGFFELALTETEKFLINFRDKYKSKMFFKGAFEVFLMNRIACLPEEVKESAGPVLERLRS